MKRFTSLLFVLPLVVSAQDVTPDFIILAQTLKEIMEIPLVGKFMKITIEIAASGTIFLTALSAFLKAILKISYVAVKPINSKIADKIILIDEKIMPYLKYFSMMNTQKSEIDKAKKIKLF